VHVERGRWQEAVARLAAQGKKFDAIFFDTYAEHYRDMQVRRVCVGGWAGMFGAGVERGGDGRSCVYLLCLWLGERLPRPPPPPCRPKPPPSTHPLPPNLDITKQTNKQINKQAFHAWLPKLLRKGGHYSFFNGLAPDNIFFHAVTCQVSSSGVVVGWVCGSRPIISVVINAQPTNQSNQSSSNRPTNQLLDN
jgi:hypothetical protein